MAVRSRDAFTHRPGMLLASPSGVPVPPTRTFGVSAQNTTGKGVPSERHV